GVLTFFVSSRRRHTRFSRDWSSDVCSSDLIAHLAVLRFLRYRLGLDRVRVAISGAAPIAPEILSYFRAIGVDVREGYGLTESTEIGRAARRGRGESAAGGRSIKQKQAGRA